MNQTPDPRHFSSPTGDDCPHLRFIERMGDHMELEGMPRIAGRLFGLFLVDPGPISFSELAERLSISRGSISTNTRLLEGKGLIERVDVPGERQDYFRLADRPFVNMIHGITARMRETMETIEADCRARKDAGVAQSAEAAGEPVPGGMRAAHEFFAECIGTLEGLAARLAKRGGEVKP
ncbi:MarR family transcriptional regulator [Fulvimarina endophytica]|uniref:MarR family transcriptional regulator n=1 Tax=Fulvimarina endophytica TaxID=2293836 RepID=A0A371X4H1_9HYPH|nr:MarR family transcriptional regulator [Fulvimarina endophytica]RFC64099.1 MarR family transcriptional regulator [Fulvimarina endophytica]